VIYTTKLWYYITIQDIDRNYHISFSSSWAFKFIFRIYSKRQQSDWRLLRG